MVFICLYYSSVATAWSSLGPWIGGNGACATDWNLSSGLRNALLEQSVRFKQANAGEFTCR
jgi:hypothetical protein